MGEKTTKETFMKKLIFTALFIAQYSSASVGDYVCSLKDSSDTVVEQVRFDLAKGNLAILKKLAPVEAVVIAEDLTDLGENRILIHVGMFNVNDPNSGTEVNADLGSRLIVIDNKSKISVSCMPQ
jgi:hypothetical protein